MPDLTEREEYLHSYLFTDQTEIYREKYLDPNGLFLHESDESELEAIVSCPSCDGENVKGSPTSSTTLTEAFGKPVELGGEKCSDGPLGYRQLVLRDESDIDRVCNEEQCGLTMIHIKQEHSRCSLQITRACFEQLAHSMGMFSAVKDTILHMGNRNSEVEVAPPSLRASHLSGSCTSGDALSDHEVSYGFRYIQRNGRSSYKPWSLRQFFVYNKSLFAEERSKWVMFSLPEVIRAEVNEYLQVAQHSATSHPLDIHLILCSAVIRTWRPYFADLNVQIEQHRSRAETTDLTSEKSVQKLGSKILGLLKSIEIDVLDAILALRATKDTLQRTKILFEGMPYSEDEDQIIKHEPGRHFLDRAMSTGLRDLDMLIDQALSLSQKAQSLSVLHANVLDLANGFSLRTLADQQSKEAEDMKKLTTVATRDTKAVKALSIITLVYLPITVVFNFFSTSFVDKGNGDMQLVGHWWMLFAISMPLTALTICIWIVCVLCSPVDRKKSRWKDSEKGG